MVTTITKKLEKITWKHWLLFLVLSQAIYIIMQTQTIPRIGQEAGGLRIFDMQPLGYTYDYAHTFLSQLSEKGYKLYKFVQLPLDILFPLVNCLTGICTFVLLIRVYRRVKGKAVQEKLSLPFKMMLSLPLAAMLSDYLENIMILVMLSYKVAVPKVLVSVANIFTLIKSMSTTVFYTISVIICIVIGVIWINNKIREVKADGKLQYKREEKSTAENSYPGRNASSTKNKGA
jgi:hypothetical protein